MSKLPRQLPGAKLVKILKKFGFEEKPSGGGSHIILFKIVDNKKTVTCVPVRDQHIGIGLLKDILTQAGISREEFLDAL